MDTVLDRRHRRCILDCRHAPRAARGGTLQGVRTIGGPAWSSPGRRTSTPSAATTCRPPTQWPELLFDLPELRYPDRLNCADRAARRRRRRARRRPALPAHRRRRPGPTASCWPRANQVAHVLTEDLGLVPGQPGAAARPEQPVAGGLLVRACSRPAASSSPPMPLLRAGELRPARRDRPGATSRCATHRFARRPRRRGGGTGLPVAAYGGGGDDDLVARAAAKPATFDDVDTAADDVALLGLHLRHHRRPEGHHALPPRRAGHRRHLRPAHVLRPAPDDVFTGTPPLAFTFGLGGLLVFPLRAGASTLLIEKATPVELADAIAAHGVDRLFTAPTAYRAMLRGRLRAAAGQPAQGGVGRRAPAARRPGRRSATRPGSRLIDGIGATEMLHVFVSAADDDIRPGRDRPRRARLPRRRSSTTTATRRPTAARAGSRSRARPAAATSTTPGRRSTSRTAGTSPATPSSATPTATSGTRPAATT